MTQLFGAGMPFHHGLFHAEKKKVKRACGNGNKSAMRDASTLTLILIPTSKLYPGKQNVQKLIAF